MAAPSVPVAAAWRDGARHGEALEQKVAIVAQEVVNANHA
jgi:hypothetical protein